MIDWVSILAAVSTIINVVLGGVVGWQKWRTDAKAKERIDANDILMRGFDRVDRQQQLQIDALQAQISNERAVRALADARDRKCQEEQYELRKQLQRIIARDALRRKGNDETSGD